MFQLQSTNKLIKTISELKFNGRIGIYILMDGMSFLGN